MVLSFWWGKNVIEDLKEKEGKPRRGLNRVLRRRETKIRNGNGTMEIKL